MPPAKSPAPRIISRTASGLPPRHYRLSAKTYYASLPQEERDAHIAREDLEFKQVQTLSHERNPPVCHEFTEKDWKAFDQADREYYEILFGKQCMMARILPGAISCINWILGAENGREFDFLLEFTEEQQIAWFNSHFRTNLSFEKLSADVYSIRMTCKEFSMVALDSFGGKFNTLMTITYKEIWQKTKLKVQTKLFVNAMSPPHLSNSIAEKLEQEEHSNIYEAFAIIKKAAKNEVERLLGNDKAKSSISDKASLPIPDKAFIPKSKMYADDVPPVVDIRANLLKSGEEPCKNCLLFGIPKGYIKHTTKACRSACACGKEPPHLAAAKGEIICPQIESPQIVNHVSYLHEEEQTESDHEDTDVIPFPHVRASRTKVQFNDDIKYSNEVSDLQPGERLHNNKSVLVIKSLTSHAGSIFGGSASDSDD